MADDEVVPGAGHRAENSRFVGGDMRSRIGHLQATRFASESEGVSEEREGIAGPEQRTPPIAGGKFALGRRRKEEGGGWSFGAGRQVGGIAGGSDRDDVSLSRDRESDHGAGCAVLFPFARVCRVCSVRDSAREMAEIGRAHV